MRTRTAFCVPLYLGVILVLSVTNGPHEGLADMVKIVSPSEADGIDGNGGGGEFDNIPFHVMWSYPATDFGVNKGMVTLFSARPDAILVTEPQVSYYQHAEFRLSTTPNAAPDLDPVFANNVGDDMKLVYDGPFSVATEDTLPFSGPPRPFTYDINMYQPFYYDPSLGNLLVDLIAPFGYFPSQHDDEHTNDSTGVVFSADVNAASGVNFPWSTVFQFSIVPGDLVPLDVKPGNASNPINPKSNGVIPVGVLSTLDFDATLVDPETVRLGDSALINEGGVPVAPLRWSYKDINHDNVADLYLKFSTRNLVDNGALGPFSESTMLTGNLFASAGGTPIVGSDLIRIVPAGVPEPSAIWLVMLGLTGLIGIRR